MESSASLKQTRLQGEKYMEGERDRSKNSESPREENKTDRTNTTYCRG